MAESESYGLDIHGQMILEEFRNKRPVYEKIKDIAMAAVEESLEKNGILVTALEGRIKKEKSLAGKLEIKGGKYSSLSDVTDVFGMRVITFYSNEVDKIAALAENIFEIDWENSVDKRKMLQLDTFGYLSLHYICKIPKELYFDPGCPEINEIRFELQMRTALQHVWANMYHDTGYKSGVEIPREYLRTLNRLAGMLELADDEFSRIRTSINDYRRLVKGLVSSGRFEEVKLDGDTFKSYMEIGPFDKISRKIAAINQAEIHETSYMPFVNVFLGLGFKTLGDIDNMIKEYTEDAYQLALHLIGGTDLDIVTSTVSIQYLCIVYVLENGGGEMGLSKLFDLIYGESSYNRERARNLISDVCRLPFMNKK